MMTVKDSKSKISIIIPVYNAEDFLTKCIYSVKNQTYENLQIIIIDDGSKDQSLDICRRFALNDHRIEVYHTENRGSVAARKYGLEIAKGDYIGFVDADDYVEPDMFSELLNILLERNADLVHAGYIEEIDGEKNRVCNFDEKVVNLNNIDNKIAFLKDYIFCETDRGGISYSLWSKLYKSEFIKKCFSYLPDGQQYGEDVICLCRCILESHSIVLTKKARYHYVVRENTLSHLEYDDFMVQEMGLWNQVFKVLEEYKCLKKIKKDIFPFFKRRMLSLVSMDESKMLYLPRYYCNNIKQIIGKKVVIYGAGKVGKDYLTQIAKYEQCEIVCWVDKNYEKEHFEYRKVIGVEELIKKEYDIILIAVARKEIAEEIRYSLLGSGIPENKILWNAPARLF